MHYGAVIVAAGNDTHNGQIRPLLNIGSISMAQRVIATLKQARIELIAVITGFQAETLEHQLASSGVVFLRNNNYATTQMFDSAVIGLEYMRTKFVRTIFTPVDVPLFTEETVTSLLASTQDIAIPTYEGIAGHPIMISAGAAAKIVKDSGQGGLQEALRRNGNIEFIPVLDKGILHDVNTIKDYNSAVAYHNRHFLRPIVIAKLFGEKEFFDGRLATLLFLIEDTHSVRLACQQMQISYSSGWKMINTSEEELGFPLVERNQGGKTGSQTILTADGENLLQRFRQFNAELKHAADQLFAKHFQDILHR